LRTGGKDRAFESPPPEYIVDDDACDSGLPLSIMALVIT
jgi:hypothetical protein